MSWLVLGLILFLGVHSLRMLSPRVREAGVAALGLMRWKAAYSLVAVIGLAMIILGYGPAGAGDTTLLWVPPIALRHGAGLLTLVAFVLVLAGNLPRNHFRSWLRHPMLIGVSLWALAHVLVNGFLHAVLLFGGFLLWSVLCLLLSWKRPPAAATRAPSWGFTLAAVVLGVALWAGFAFWAHIRLMGVAPFGTTW
ncbi:NnrU family protein [Arenimonas fontis]|uniref:NnrU family protein n=1 Tax=Arenimonas fontis TaxID=2608255 RepID=A0A5B2ZBE8_9GAMM|nr:NnrU family protein [Arenimonas fontis]KAA2284481.1 NnrU family protein [Arenimonas fontis]